jgi:hypothetical protein
MDRFQDGNARLTAAAAATGAIAAVARTRPHRAIPRRGSRCAASGPRGTNAAPLGTSRGSDNARQLAGSRTCARHRPDLLHTARRVVLTGSFLSLPLSLSLSLSLSWIAGVGFCQPPPEGALSGAVAQQQPRHGRGRHRYLRLPVACEAARGALVLVAPDLRAVALLRVLLLGAERKPSLRPGRTANLCQAVVVRRPRWCHRRCRGCGWQRCTVRCGRRGQSSRFTGFCGQLLYARVGRPVGSDSTGHYHRSVHLPRMLGWWSVIRGSGDLE